MDNKTFIALLFCTVILTGFAGFALEQHSKERIKIECYKAAQVNRNIKCEAEK